jgi:glyoxylase-like metal-dependent hydrolase (beta-lactamase superfamily II)
MIHTFKTMIVNSYLVKAPNYVLVDTGTPNNGKRIINSLAKMDIAPKDISLILLTHAHGDHAGSAEELRRLTGAPIAVHHLDADMLARGDNGKMLPIGIEARMSQPFVDRPFPSVKADILLKSQTDIDQLGIKAKFLHTPGHSDGSISLVFDSGEAIVGDILRGGIMGGSVMSWQPTYPYFLYDMAHQSVLYSSIQSVLDAGATRFYVGHGGWLSRQRVATWLTRHLAKHEAHHKSVVQRS